MKMALLSAPEPVYISLLNIVYIVSYLIFHAKIHFIIQKILRCRMRGFRLPQPFEMQLSENGVFFPMKKGEV